MAAAFMYVCLRENVYNTLRSDLQQDFICCYILIWWKRWKMRRNALQVNKNHMRKILSYQRHFIRQQPKFPFTPPEPHMLETTRGSSVTYLSHLCSSHVDSHEFRVWDPGAPERGLLLAQVPAFSLGVFSLRAFQLTATEVHLLFTWIQIWGNKNSKILEKVCDADGTKTIPSWNSHRVYYNSCKQTRILRLEVELTVTEFMTFHAHVHESFWLRLMTVLQAAVMPGRLFSVWMLLTVSVVIVLFSPVVVFVLFPSSAVWTVYHGVFWKLSPRI